MPRHVAVEHVLGHVHDPPAGGAGVVAQALEGLALVDAVALHGANRRCGCALDLARTWRSRGRARGRDVSSWVRSREASPYRAGARHPPRRAVWHVAEDRQLKGSTMEAAVKFGRAERGSGRLDATLWRESLA